MQIREGRHTAWGMEEVCAMEERGEEVHSAWRMKKANSAKEACEEAWGSLAWRFGGARMLGAGLWPRALAVR